MHNSENILLALDQVNVCPDQCSRFFLHCMVVKDMPCQDRLVQASLQENLMQQAVGMLGNYSPGSTSICMNPALSSWKALELV